MEGMGDLFPVGSLIRPEKVKPILTRWSFKYFYECERNQVCLAIFLLLRWLEKSLTTTGGELFRKVQPLCPRKHKIMQRGTILA